LNKIVTKLLLLIVICSVVVAVAISSISVRHSSDILYQEINEQLSYISKNYANEFSITLESVENTVNTLSAAVQTEFDRSQFIATPSYRSNYMAHIDSLIKTVGESTDNIQGIYVVIDPTLLNKVFTSWFISNPQGGLTPQEPEDIATFYPSNEDMGWYYDPIREKEGVWQLPLVDVTINIKMISYTKPIFQGDELVGVVGIDISFDEIEKQISTMKVLETGYPLLLSSDLSIILHPSIESGTYIGDIENENLEDMISSMQNNPSGISSYQFEGEQKILGFSKLSNGWVFSVTAPKQEVLAPISSLKERITLSVIILILIMIGVGVFIATTVTRPLKKAVELAHKIRSGDLTQRLHMKGHDEIYELANALDSMAESLQSRTQELVESRRNMSVTLDAIGDGVIVTDKNGCTVRMNPVAEQVTNWSIAEARGKKLPQVFAIFNHSTNKEVSNPFEEVLANDEIFYLPQNTYILSKDQKKFMIDDSAAPIRLESGEVIGVVVVFRDVTEQLKMENQLRQSQKLDAIGQLAGGVAHDFNNMLGGIQGATELLQDSATEDQKEMLNIVQSASEKAAKLTKELLLFSRKSPQASTAIDVHSIIEETCFLLSRTIDRRVSIVQELNATNSLIVGDDTFIQNALTNMGINASHAMSDGGTLTFKTDIKELDALYCAHSGFDIQPGAYISIEVIDTGCGMTQDVQQRIFEPFFTTKSVGKGTGLGMSAVFNMVVKHKGAITVYSEVGVGTSFHILLPLTEKNEKQLISKLEELPQGTGTILLADDEEIIRLTATAMLQKLGYSVIAVENGKDAITVLAEATVDLIILDMIMPVMNGRDTYEEILRLGYKTPVILASGFSKEDDVTTMKEKGLFGFLHKPYQRKELAQMVADAIQAIEVESPVSR